MFPLAVNIVSKKSFHPVRKLFYAGAFFSQMTIGGLMASHTQWDADAYRQRGLMAQERAAEAPTEALKTLWLELAERYFEMADQIAAEDDPALRLPHRLRAPQGGRILL